MEDLLKKNRFNYKWFVRHEPRRGFDHVNYFRVYNRWGKLLFQMNSDRPGWDGRVNGQVTTETQTVVWMIEAVDVDGVLHRKQGTTVLMK